ncbi:MAG: GH25 family lysozyme [Clostridia bacterium]
MNSIKKILTICSSLVLVLGLSAGVWADDPQGETEREVEPLSAGIFASDVGMTYPSLFPIWNDTIQQFEDCTYIVPSIVTSSGIDVSRYQGNIDWQAVADDGVDFAFIRVAYRGYETGNLQEDSYFRRNIEEAQKAGIRVGVYIYSQAITEDEAREEAAYLMHKVAGYQMDLPLVFDYEFAGKSGRLYEAYKNGNLGREKATDICLAFCHYVESFGYDSIVYANASMLNNQLDSEKLEKETEVWLANYTKNTAYQGDFKYWQYTDSGKVDGINTNVDCNFAFVKKTYASGNGCFPFIDVTSDIWYYEAIKYAYDHDLFNGTSWNRFAPDSAMTRAMLISVLYRMEGSPKAEGDSGFTDLTQDWYKSAVLWAKQNNIVSGISNTVFGPDQPVTREQMATILQRYAAYKHYNTAGLYDLSFYSDGMSVSSYAVSAVQWAVNKGYISGFPEGTLEPRSGATRAQVASILERFCKANSVN